MNQPGSGHVGGGPGAGKVSVHDLSFTKYIDMSSPDLMLACCNGKHYAEAQLTRAEGAARTRSSILSSRWTT